MQEDPTRSWFCNTFLTHITVFSGRLGAGPTLRGGRSHVQGMWRKILSRGIQSLPLWKLSASWWEMPPRQSSDPAFPKGQGTQSYHLHTASSQGLLPRVAGGGGTLIWLWIKPSTSWPQLLPRARTQPWRTPGLLPKHKPLVLYTRHWTNSSTNKIKSLLHATP